MAALGAAEFTQVFSATLAENQKELKDQVLLNRPFLAILKKSLRSISGPAFNIQVILAGLGSTTQTDAAGTFSQTVSAEILGTASYVFSFPFITRIRLGYYTILENAGSNQLHNLAKVYRDKALSEHSDAIVAQVLQLRTAWVTGQLESLDSLVATTDTISTTAYHAIGGIRGGTSTTAVTNKALTSNVATLTVGAHDYIVGDSVVVADVHAVFNGTHTITAVAATTFSYAKTNADVVSAACTGSAVVALINDYWKATRRVVANTEQIDTAFRKTINAIYLASRKRPTIIIAGSDIYEAYEALVNTKLFIQPSDSIDLKFTSIKFGKLEVRLDPDMQANRAYFLYEPSIKIVDQAGEFMKSHPPIPTGTTPDSVMIISSKLCLYTDERRANGLLIWG